MIARGNCVGRRGNGQKLDLIDQKITPSTWSLVGVCVPGDDEHQKLSANNDGIWLNIVRTLVKHGDICTISIIIIRPS